MPTKQDLQDMVNVYKDQIEFFKAQIRDLKVDNEVFRAQVFKLQDGILNIRAPEAYRDMKADEATPPDFTEQRSEIEERNKVISQHLSNIESPIFSDVDDMMSSLAGVVFSEMSETTPLHPNDES